MTRAALLLALVVMPAAAQAAPAFPAGAWFGQGEPQDKSEMFLVHGGADGRIHVQFRLCRQGKAFDFTNDGTWSRSGNRLTVRYLLADGAALSAPHDDLYTLLSSEGGRQSYRLDSNGYVFTARAVDAKFQMPPCDLTS